MSLTDQRSTWHSSGTGQSAIVPLKRIKVIVCVEVKYCRQGSGMWYHCWYSISPPGSKFWKNRSASSASPTPVVTNNFLKLGAGPLEQHPLSSTNFEDMRQVRKRQINVHFHKVLQSQCQQWRQLGDHHPSTSTIHQPFYVRFASRNLGIRAESPAPRPLVSASPGTSSSWQANWCIGCVKNINKPSENTPNDANFFKVGIKLPGMCNVCTDSAKLSSMAVPSPYRRATFGSCGLLQVVQNMAAFNGISMSAEKVWEIYWHKNIAVPFLAAFLGWMAIRSSTSKNRVPIVSSKLWGIQISLPSWGKLLSNAKRCTSSTVWSRSTFSSVGSQLSEYFWPLEPLEWHWNPIGLAHHPMLSPFRREALPWPFESKVWNDGHF